MFTTSFWVLYLMAATLLCFSNRLAQGISELEQPKRCNMERAYKMLGYNCAKLDLRTIPQSLKSSTEMLDLSHNRIRDLDKNSFARYTDLKYIYIFDNMLQNIEEDTFKELTFLEALDISNNALQAVPVELFNLPKLRNLYLHGNSLRDIHRNLEKVSKPIKAPLKLLNLADTRLMKVPNFGILPDLYFLNISSNPLYDVTAQQFSPFCQLTKIDLNNTQMTSCTCNNIRKLFKQRKVDMEIHGMHCDSTSSESNCDTNSTLAQETNENFECAGARRTRIEHQEAQSAWMTVAFSLAGFLVAFIAVLYCIHRANVRRIHHEKKINNLNLVTVPQNKSPSDNQQSNGPEKLLVNDLS